MAPQQTPPFNLSDQISLVKMDWLTSIGRSILPAGYWGAERSAGENEESGSNGRTKTLYLTYDDGPNPQTTRQLLELLDEEKVPATFFFIGSHIDRHQELA